MFRNVFFSNETGGVNQGNVSSKFVESIPFVSVVTNILDFSMAFFYPICELYCTLSVFDSLFNFTEGSSIPQ